MIPWHRWASALTLAVLLAGCGGHGSVPTEPPFALGLPTGFERAFPDVSFPGMTDIRSQPDAAGVQRLFVTLKEGRIVYFEPRPDVNAARPYLDVTASPALADFSTDGEQGLLGLAFDPDYATNRYLYVHVVQTDPRRVSIVRYYDDPATPDVDPDTAVIVLEADDFDFQVDGMTPTNHVAGGIAFGPNDGYLYLTMGDGGSSYDPQGAAQDRTNLRGSILRIDVSVTTSPPSTQNYAIPDDNPYFDNPDVWREEIYAFGLRNPWRLSIERVDADTQRVWVGDVGQNAREEIDVIEAGGNYGWDCYEGTLMVPPANDSDTCPGAPTSDFEQPVHEYTHDFGDSSITGGYVYNGTRLRGELTGRYVYGDFGSGRIWALDPDTGDNDLLVTTGLNISTFGVGPEGELYFSDYTTDGGLYRLAP